MDLEQRRFQVAMLVVTIVTIAAPAVAADVPKLASLPPNKCAKPLKAFVQAGQSNMQGHAQVSTFDSLADDPKTAPLLKEMRGPDGKPWVCKQVWSSSVGCLGDAHSDLREQTGKLTAGFGAPTFKNRPESAFGITMEKRAGEPLLIIKSAWDGRSLATDFHLSSTGKRVFGSFIQKRWIEMCVDPDREAARHNSGLNDEYYRRMLDHVRHVLKDIKRVVPDYDPKQGYELAGFFWLQRFNDYVDSWTYHERNKRSGYDEYTEPHGRTNRQVLMKWKGAARTTAIDQQFNPEAPKRLEAGASHRGDRYLGAAETLTPAGKAFADTISLEESIPTPPAKDGSLKPVKVFVLAGQSNMEGQGFIEADPKRNEGKGSLQLLTKDQATADKYKHLVAKNGQWATRNDVWIHYLDRKGKLTVGYGANEDRIGPELGFGTVIGDAFEETVLLIKLAWGAKSLAKDFRPPSSGGETGPYYKEIVERTKTVLKDLKTEFPEFGDRGYELAGFGWHQGWNDRIDQAFNDEYEKHLANFIRDVREDLGAKDLTFVIAETGMSGPDERHPRALSLMKAQAAVAEYQEFQATLAFVGTRAFWRDRDVSPTGQAYHWNTNAETYYLIGESMGKAMKELCGPKPPAH